jgi:putative transcriptional regulator
MTVTVSEGDLLIAPPSMLDRRFGNTVLLMTKHDRGGSSALCLNKSTEYGLRELLKPLNLDIDIDPEVYWGGPVSQNTVWMLHDNSWGIDNTQRINDAWSMTSHHRMFHYLANGEWPDCFRIMMGHACWAPGQLEGELRGHEPWKADHSWLVAQGPDPSWLLGCDTSDMWQSATSFCSQQAVDSWL